MWMSWSQAYHNFLICLDTLMTDAYAAYIGSHRKRDSQA